MASASARPATEPTEIAGAMGACVVLPRAHWDPLGGFDDHYFAYVEDAEISLRTWRLGLRVVNVPTRSRCTGTSSPG